MPIHDRIGRAISKGFGALAGAAGDVLGGVVQQLPGALLGGIFGGPPTSRGESFDELARRFPGPVSVPRGPIQRTLPGVPGDPLGGALRFPMQEAPMAFPVTALPGGAPIRQAGLGGLGAFGAGVATNLLGEGIFQGLFGNGGNGQMGVCPPLFVPAQAQLRAVRMFRVTNPSTGTDVWYRNAGRPILWSGDFAAVKRVRRVAGKARRKR